MNKNDENKMIIPFSPPDVGKDEIAEVADTLRSGWITTGPKTKLLEKKVAEWIGTDHTDSGTPRCVCLNSQTACAEMAMHIMGIGEIPGGSVEDEVIVPAYTYTASAAVACHVGAKLVLVDIQKDSFQMDYDAVEKLINEHTKAIIPVDLGGVPCDYDRIFAIVNSKKNMFHPSNEIQKAMGHIAVMADTAHAFGAKWHDRMVGSIADFSSFSWHAVKNFTTAEGGCLTWKHINGVDDDELYHKLQLLSLHGQSKDAFHKTLGAWEYDVVDTWYKCNMTDIAAAIGLAQFKRYPAMLTRRKEIIGRYDVAFKPLGIEVLPHYSDSYQSSGHLYITRIPGIRDAQRREIIIKMAEAGISCNVHYKPLPMMTAYKKMGFDIQNFQNSYVHYDNEITLPLHTCLTDEQVDYVMETYKTILKEYIR